MELEDANPTRRSIVRSGALGFAAALTPALASSAAGAQATNAHPGAAPNLTDPRDEYPLPPFQAQSQPWPGLALRMTPQPDNGLKSYRGSRRLTGRKALVAGGDSGIGSAAAIAFGREGADVAICFLPSEEPDASEVIAAIRAAGRMALPIPGDIRSERFCNELVA
jgi:hypothetical protein